MDSQQNGRRLTIAFVAPFAAYVTLMSAEKALKLPAGIFYPIRIAVTMAILLVVSRPFIPFRPTRGAASAAIGAAVFVIWIAPDLLFGAGYRSSWLFHNAITGTAVSSVPADVQRNALFSAVRAVGCVVAVPLAEELFWRGWLIRWLVSREFWKVSYGTYAAQAFWITVVLFGSEHGPYWEVGLATGAIYNWWLIETRNLADCIVAHAVTNGLLSGWVLATGQWQYWL